MFDQIEPMTPEEAAAVEAKLDAYDRAAVPPVSGAEAEEIVLKIEDGGRIVAGCAAYVDDWKCMDLSCLWVDGRYRNRGMGTQLFSEMLRAGKAIGCHLAAVGLYSFQASAFCEKRGMTVYDRKEDCPKGHAHEYLFIRLDGDEPIRPPKGEPYRIERGSDEDCAFLVERFYAYSDSQVPRRHEGLSFDRKITDGAGKLIAGVEACVTGWDVGYVLFQWTEEPYRGQGLGSALLSNAEREIRENGGKQVLVSAFDWQDAAFYQARGYVITGKLPDCPKGHCLYSLSKDL